MNTLLNFVVAKPVYAGQTTDLDCCDVDGCDTGGAT